MWHGLTHHIYFNFILLFLFSLTSFYLLIVGVKVIVALGHIGGHTHTR